MLLLLDDSTQSFYLETLSNYLHLPKSFKLKILHVTEAMVQSGVIQTTTPSLVDDEGQVFLSVRVISQKLCEIVNLDEILVGETEEEQNEIGKYFEIFASPIGDVVQQLNTELETKTFLFGHHVTCADLFVFCMIQKIIVDFDVLDLLDNNNLMRWFNNLQHMRVLRDLWAQSGIEIVEYPSTVKLSNKQLKKMRKAKDKASGKAGAKAKGGKKKGKGKQGK